MNITPIKYKSGYKHQLVEDFTVQTNIYGNAARIDDYIELTTDGLLTVKKGYSFDSASGPTYDTDNVFRGACAHDALYQLIRERRLPEWHRKSADELAYKIWRYDGMSIFRAKVWFWSLRKFAAYAAEPGSEKKVTTFP